MQPALGNLEDVATIALPPRDPLPRQRLMPLILIELLSVSL